MNYWDERYSEEAAIWGALPSRTVVKADTLFRECGAESILIPGCGYGRNANYFEKRGYSVTGVDLSERAIVMARRLNPRVEFIRGSFFDIDFADGSFDAGYCYNFLQYLLEPERKLFVKRVFDLLRGGGLLYLTVFSEEEKGFGSGHRVEDATFEALPGRPVHYFSRNDLIDCFVTQTVIEEGTFEESEDHTPKGPHIHYMRYAVVKG
jgi:SAM-dependent methyltransferase